MAKDLIYGGLDTFTLEDEKKKKKTKAELHIERARKLRTVARNNRLMEGWKPEHGDVSSVKMAQGYADGREVAFPTLFPRDPNKYTENPADWYEPDNPYEVAKKRGEVFIFNTRRDALDFAGGSWKEKQPMKQEADARQANYDLTTRGTWEDRRNAQRGTERKVELEGAPMITPQTTPLYPEVEEVIPGEPEREAAAIIGEQAQPEPYLEGSTQEKPAQEPYTPKTREEWEKWIGFDKMEDLEPYTDERREARSQKQQEMYNMAQGLRTVMQAISGGMGSYMSPFKQDVSTPRIQAELTRIRDAADVDERRVRLQNFSKELQKMGLYSDYLTREGGYEQAEGMQDTRIEAAAEALDKSIASRKEIAGMSLKQSKEQHAKQYDAKWQQELSNITQARQEALYKAQTEEQKQRENDKYDRMEQYQQFLKDNDLKSTIKTNTAATVTDKDGKEHDLTQLKINSIAFDIISWVRNLSKTGANTRAWKDLPTDIKRFAYGTSKITEQQMEMLVRQYYAGEFDEAMGIAEGKAGTLTPLDESEAGTYTQ